jgi:hypothetical protein
MANTYLNRTQTAGTSTRKFTFSAWVKRAGQLGASYSVPLFGSYYDDSNRGALYCYQDQLLTYFKSGGSDQFLLKTKRKFRDTNGWYHFVMAVDTTQSTANNRVKLYVNGEQIAVGDLETNNQPSQNADFATVGVNSRAFEVGRMRYGSTPNNVLFDGYMSHASFVDGQALAPTVFGSTDSTSGIWKFKSPSGVTWGNNGFHLKFESSGNLGLDSSGNSNTFTVNGNGRQSLDTPSNVYATLNPLSSSATLTTGNTTGATADSTWRPASTTIGMLGTTGKYYAEFKVISGNNNYVGVYNLNTNFGTSQSTADANRIAYSTYDGEIMRTLTGESTIAGLATSGSSDVVGIAINKNDGEVKFYKNGTLIQTVSHSNITNYDLMIGCQLGYTSSSCFNFGNGYFGTTAISSAGSNGNGSLFEYDVPSGYYALNTKNINTYG